MILSEHLGIWSANYSKRLTTVNDNTNISAGGHWMHFKLVTIQEN